MTNKQLLLENEQLRKAIKLAVELNQEQAKALYKLQTECGYEWTPVKL